VLDSLIVCKFLRKCFTDFYTEAAEILARVTGWEYTSAEMRRAGERIHTLKKQFNNPRRLAARQRLAARTIVERKPTDGVARGVGLSREELEEMIRGYYQAREWDENGFVPERKLEQLEIPTS